MSILDCQIIEAPIITIEARNVIKLLEKENKSPSTKLKWINKVID